MMRIPGIKNHFDEKERPPIFFVHGFAETSDTWVLNHANNTPAFVAVNQGYDVWLGNSRGNKYSSGHLSLDPKEDAQKYWDFDWVEMGRYDVPACVDYILDKTGFEKVAYVGHSQGTTQMFSVLADHEDILADKISAFVGLGPVTKISHVNHPALRLEIQYLTAWF